MAENPQSAAMSDPGLFEKWKGWLGAPQNRAALLQTGLSLMQPVAVGQSQFGHIASSIGQGLGAAGRAEGRIAGEKRDAEKLQRELESESLDREVKRTGLELDKLNQQSLIGDRAEQRRLAQARLGLDTEESKLGRKKTELEIANLEKGGGLTLDKMFGAAKDITEISSLTNQPVADTTQSYLEAVKTLQGGLNGERGQSGPAQVPPPQAQSSTYPSPKSAADFAALPSGTVFMAPDGSLRKKP